MLVLRVLWRRVLLRVVVAGRRSSRLCGLCLLPATRCIAVAPARLHEHRRQTSTMAAVSEAAASLPYHEPGIVPILVLTSFLLLLNVVNAALDKLLYCGLLGQVFVGIAWGTPGAKWLSTKVEDVVVQLGYLGLILLVYQGWSRAAIWFRLNTDPRQVVCTLLSNR